MVARSVADVIAGEAVSGSQEERWNDMVAIASVIKNRADQLGVSPEDVISAMDKNGVKQFDAYGKALPSGAEQYTGMAQQAMDYVQTNGPVTNATFYATPSAVDNIGVDGLETVGQTTGHVYLDDPQKRSILTAQGYRQPQMADVAGELSTGSPAAGGADGLLSQPAMAQTTPVNAYAAQPANWNASQGLQGLLADQAQPQTSSQAIVSQMGGDWQQNDLGLGPAQLPDVSYDMGPKRPNMPDPSVVNSVQYAVDAALGPGYSVSITSGKDDATQDGSNRHGTGLAVDVAIRDPNGQQVTLANDPQAMRDVGQAFSAITGGSVGLGYTDASGNPTNTFHMDAVPDSMLSAGQDHSWGTVGNDPQYAGLLADARQNQTMPDSYYNKVADAVTANSVVPSSAPRDELPSDAMAYTAPVGQVTAGDLPAAMDVSRGLLGGIPAAQEISPAINSVPDPMQAASMGAYTDNGLTNSSGFGPVGAEVVNPTAINSQAVNPAFSPSGFYAATPQSTIGGDIPQGLMSQPSYNQPANNNLDPAFAKSGLLTSTPQQTMGLLGNQAQAYNPGMLFDSTLAQVAPEFSVQPQTQVQQVQPDIQQTAIRGPSNIAAVQQQAVQNVQAPQQQEQPQTLADKVFSKGTAGQLGGGLLGGMVLGPVGGILGAIAGRHMMENGGLGSLGGLLSSQPMNINNIGGGLSNVQSVYGGADRGTTANTNNGGTVTAMGDGRVAVRGPSGSVTISNADGTGQATDFSGIF